MSVEQFQQCEVCGSSDWHEAYRGPVRDGAAWAVLFGIVLIILGLLVGPGGVSIFDDDDDGDVLPAQTMEVA